MSALLLSLAVVAGVVPPPSASASSEVNTITGQYLYSRTDVAIAGRGPSLVFSRSYNSGDTRVTALGPGWTHSYAIRLNSPGDGTSDIILVGPQGRSDRYTWNPDGTFSPPPAIATTLVVNNNFTYVATLPDQTTWTFNGRGRLTSIKDRDGNESLLTYNAAGQPTSISDPAGRGALTLAYDTCFVGRLCSVTDWAGRAVEFGYDSTGRLQTVADREHQTTSFAYDGTSQRLTTIADANNHVAMRIAYDDRGRVATQLDARGVTTGLEKRSTYEQRPDGSQFTTTSYPPSAFEPTWHPLLEDTYDTLGRIVQRISRPTAGEAYVERYAYDAHSNRIGVTDGAGNPIAQHTVARWRGASCVSDDPLRDTPEDELDADTVGAPVAMRFADTAAEAGMTVTSYESGSMAGMVQQVTDAVGNTAAFEYDLVGRLTTLTTSAAAGSGAAASTTRRWRFSYDNEDRVRTVEAPGLRASSPPQRTEFRYDAVGNRTVVIDPTGQVTRYRYDERDGLQEVERSRAVWRDPAGEPPTKSTVAYAYDERGDLAQVTWLEDGQATRRVDYAHDGVHRLRTETSYPNWPDTSYPAVITYSYNQAGDCQ